MRAPVFTPTPQGPASGAAYPDEEPPTRRTGGNSVPRSGAAGTGLWADRVLGGAARSQPRRPSVPSRGIDNVGDHGHIPTVPPPPKSPEAREPTTRRTDRPGPPPGDASITEDVQEEATTQVNPKREPVNDPLTRDITNFIDSSLDDEPVSEVGPLDFEPEPHLSMRPPSNQALPAVDAPWGTDETAGLPPLGSAVNSLAMAAVDDDMSLATLDGLASAVQPLPKVEQPSGGNRVMFTTLTVLITLATAAGGLWFFRAELNLFAPTAAGPGEQTATSAPAAMALAAESPVAVREAVAPEAEEVRVAPPVEAIAEVVEPEPEPAPEGEAAGEEAAVEAEAEAAPEAEAEAQAEAAPEAEAATEELPATADPAPVTQAEAATAVAQGDAPIAETVLPRAERVKRARKLVNQAAYYRNNGRHKDAAKNYRAALKLNRTYPLAMAGLTRSYLSLKNSKLALHWAKRLTRIQSKRSNNQLLLGDAYAMAGNTAQARKAWTRSVSLGGKRAAARLK